MNLAGLTQLLVRNQPCIVHEYEINEDRKENVASTITGAFTELATVPTCDRLKNINDQDIREHYIHEESHLQKSYVILNAIQHVLAHAADLSTQDMNALAGLTVGLTTNKGYKIASASSMLSDSRHYTADSLIAELNSRKSKHHEIEETNALFANKERALQAIEVAKSSITHQIFKQADFAAEEMMYLNADIQSS